MLKKKPIMTELEKKIETIRAERNAQAQKRLQANEDAYRVRERKLAAEEKNRVLSSERKLRSAALRELAYEKWVKAEKQPFATENIPTSIVVDRDRVVSLNTMLNTSSIFFACFRFIENPLFDLQKLKNRLDFTTANLRRFPKPNCPLAARIQQSVIYPEPFADFIEGGSVCVVKFAEEAKYLKFIRASMLLEEQDDEEAKTALFNLLLVKERDALVVDVRLSFPGAKSARALFKTYESRASLMMELQQLLSSPWLAFVGPAIKDKTEGLKNSPSTGNIDPNL